MNPDARTIIATVSCGRPMVARLVRSSCVPTGSAGLDPLAELTDAAGAANFAVHTARGGPAEAELPWGIVTQLLPGTPLSPTDRLPGLTGLLAAASRRPVLLVVRAAHWADQDSVRWLRALLRRMPGRAVGLVLAGADGPVLRDPELFSATGVDLVDMSPQETDQSIMDHREAARLVARLRPAARALLRGAAIAGGLLDLPTLARITGADQAGAAELDTAVAASGLTDRAGGLLVVEATARQQLLSTMSATERGDLHARIARMAHQLATDDLAVGQILLDAPALGEPWATGVLVRGSRIARAGGRPELAARLLGRALAEPELAEPDRPLLWLELACAEVVTNPQASDHRLTMVIGAAGADRNAVRARAADLMLARGDAAGVARALGSAREFWWPPKETPEASQTLRALYWLAGELSAAPVDAVYGGVPDLDEPVEQPSQAGVLALRLAGLGVERERCVELARMALSTARPDDDGPIMPRIAACFALSYADNAAEADAGLGYLLALARHRGAKAIEAAVLVQRADLEIRTGRLDCAERDLAAADRALPPTAWHPSGLAHPLATKIAVALMCERPEDARELAASQVPAGAEDGFGWPLLVFIKGMVELANGAFGQARDLLIDCGRLLRVRGLPNPAVAPWRAMLADLHRTLGSPDLAADITEEEYTLAHRWAGPTGLGRAELRAAMLLREGKVAATRRAVGIFRESPARPEYAYSLVQLAAVLLDEDPAQDVTALLDEAEAVISPYLWVRLRTQIELLDQRRTQPHGERRQTYLHPLWTLLSPAEQRVVMLAAQGHANGEIASQFAITKRTVEVHLTRAYRKLRITGRAELSDLVDSGTDTSGGRG